MGCIGPCGEGVSFREKKSYGWWSYLRALWSGRIEKSIQELRLSICRICMRRELDDCGKKTNVRLFRLKKKIPFCGAPRRLLKRRDAKKVGCGCNLQHKVKWKNAQCPHKKWGPSTYLGPQIPVYDHQRVIQRTPNTIDIHVRAKYRPSDCNGIGDLMMALQLAKGLKHYNPGKDVRLFVIEKNVPWARLGWDNVLDEGNHIPGDDERWAVKDSHLSHDLKAIRANTNRMVEWARSVKTFPLPVRLKKNSDALIWAQRELREPLVDEKKIIALAPFCNSIQRHWPVTHWLRLCRKLKKAGHHVYVIDGPEGKDRTSLFNCMRYWGLDPHRVVSLLTYTDLLIGCDSGPIHIAGTLGKEALAICAPSSGRIAFSHYKSVKWIQAPGKCTGCLWQSEKGFDVPCLPACELMWYLKPDQVIEATRVVLETKGERQCVSTS